MIDVTTLLVSAAISAFVLSSVIFSICLVMRQSGYLVTMGGGVLCGGLAAASLAIYRTDAAASWAGISMMIMTTMSVLLIRWAVWQYMRLGRFNAIEFASFPALMLCCGLFLAGYDGVAFIGSHLAIAGLAIDTSLRYRWYGNKVPLVMKGLSFVGLAIALLFTARAMPLILNQQWIIGSAPTNWTEALTAIAALCLFTVLGPVVVALYYVQDRVALISEAVTDPLTGLRNRRALLDRFGEASFTSSMAVIMFDLDHFKRTNDVFGHQTGDEVLKRFAHVINRHVSNDMKSYRLGGEEFVIISTRGGESRAHDFANRIKASFSEEVVKTELGSLRSTVSCGVAAGSASASRLDELLAQADAALYEAKRTGRNRVVSNSQMPTETLPKERKVA